MKQLREYNTLKEYVREWLDSEIKKGFTFAEIVDDMRKGCRSGRVNQLSGIGQKDEFFEHFQYELNTIIAKIVNDSDRNIYKLIPDLDPNDPLFLGMANRKVVVWFGFETVFKDLIDF